MDLIEVTTQNFSLDSTVTNIRYYHLQGKKNITTLFMKVILLQTTPFRPGDSIVQDFVKI